MTVYEECSQCEKYLYDLTDYFSGIGLVCEDCKTKLLKEINDRP